MDEAMQYLISCADKGDLQEFLKKSKGKKCIYKGSNDIDLHFKDGKIIKVTHAGVPLKIVEL